MKLGEVWSSVNSSKIKQHASAINTCRLAKWVWWVEKAHSNKSRFIGFNCACLRQWREIFKLLPKHTKKISQKILTCSEKRLLVANRHYPVWRHPLLREKGVCSQDNMYKYFKNSIIRKPLFTLYHFFLPYNGVTWNVYDDDMTASLLLITLNDIDHLDVDDEVMIRY